MNTFPNFISRIEDGGEVYQVHFVAVFSKSPEAVPVMSLHGWPGKPLAARKKAIHTERGQAASLNSSHSCRLQSKSIRRTLFLSIS